MIKSVQIKNFQSHEDTKLKLHPSVNVIIGSSDSGKTAILRALRFAMWNKPGGDAFRSTWGGKTSVKIETDKCVVTRTKGSKNLYALESRKYDTMTSSFYTAFGTSVPEPIKKALNVSEINLQQQFDSHFLLNETSGNVAKFFNKIAHFEKIDTSLSFINSKISKINSSLKHYETDVLEKKEQLKKYKGLKKLKTKITELETLENEIKLGYEDLNSIDVLLDQIKYASKEINKLKDLLELKSKITELLELNADKKEKNDLHFTLTALILHTRIIKEKVEKLNKLAQLKKPVTYLLLNIQSKAILQVKYNTLQSLLQNIQLTNKSVVKLTENALQLFKQFEKEMGDICILCGSKLNN